MLLFDVDCRSVRRAISVNDVLLAYTWRYNSQTLEAKKI